MQNDPNIDGKLEKHYITIFMRGAVSAGSPELVNLEPHKCESWSWVPWEDVVSRAADNPESLFEPMRHLVAGLSAEARSPFA